MNKKFKPVEIICSAFILKATFELKRRETEELYKNEANKSKHLTALHSTLMFFCFFLKSPQGLSLHSLLFCILKQEAISHISVKIHHRP